MNAVQIIQNLCVKLRQLLVQTDDPVFLALAAFFLVRTAAAILALKIFLGSAVFIALYRPAVNEMEFLSVRADWQTTFIDREIYRSVWIVAIFLVLAFFFIHGKLHIFFHADDYHLGGEPGVFPQRGSNGDTPLLVRLDIANRALNVISRQELIVSHVVAFHSHECCVMVGFGVTVAVIPAYFNAFRVFFQNFFKINHIYRMSVLQYFSISLTDAYPFSINANSIIFSKVF